MVKGQFRCLGSSQHLKDKFSNGYEIDLKVQDVEDHALAAFFAQRPELDEKKKVTSASLAADLKKLEFSVEPTAALKEQLAANKNLTLK